MAVATYTAQQGLLPRPVSSRDAPQRILMGPVTSVRLRLVERAGDVQQPFKIRRGLTNIVARGEAGDKYVAVQLGAQQAESGGAIRAAGDGGTESSRGGRKSYNGVTGDPE